MDYQIVVNESENKAFEEFLHQHIRKFNNQHSPAHLATRKPGAIRSLNLIVKDESGNMVGGLTAKMYWDWLEIEDFFLPTIARGEGLGTSLLEQAEEIAKQQGQRHVHLTTFEFQARTFYEKQGYRVVGQLDGYPPGSAYYWMRKDLLSDSF
ncbi:MAG: GNAT family N-acetyltransferase [Chloroflexota bacterium]